MHNSEPLFGPALVIVCALMALVAAIVAYRVRVLGSFWVVPRAAIRAVLQLAAVALVLGAAIAELWSSLLILLVMFSVAAVTAARRSQASHGSAWLAVALAAGMVSVVPLLVVSGVVPFTGVALVPIFGIVLGGTMTAISVASRRSLDELDLRFGEVEAGLSLGISERDSRLEVISRSFGDALLPNLDQARTAGLVTLPGAFVGVLLATGSATQAASVQVLVLISLLLAQSCGVAVTAELIASGRIVRDRNTGLLT